MIKRISVNAIHLECYYGGIQNIKKCVNYTRGSYSIIFWINYRSFRGIESFVGVCEYTDFVSIYPFLRVLIYLYM